MKKKSILFILPEFGFGGTVFSTLNMIYLLRDHYDISVLAMSHQGPVKEKYSDINILPEDFLIACCFDAYGQIKSFRKKVFATLIRLVERMLGWFGWDFRGTIYSICAKRYDGLYDYVACCQEGASTIFLSKFKKSIKIAWFRSEYSVYRKQLPKTRLRREEEAYNRIDKIVCVSNTTREDMANYLLSISDRIIAIHNIQNCENIIEKSKEAVDDPFDDKRFNIVSVGRFAPQKQFHLIPSIARELKNKGVGFQWYIIGDGNQEGARDRFDDALSKYDVEDCVFAIGSRLNPYPYISMANILVSTSYYEACPRVVAESKILHTPVISSDYSSAREFIVDGETGYVDSIDNLSSIISDLIQNREHYLRLCHNSEKYTMEIDDILKQLLTLFK
jgi:glycosyltransferase involved in cell wall biosynthesis